MKAATVSATLLCSAEEGCAGSPRRSGRVNDWPVVRFMEVLRAHFPELRERYKVSWLGMFGSYVRNEQHKRSDLDVLVEFSETPGLLRYIELEQYLSKLLRAKVDLVMKDALRLDRRISRRILAEVLSI